MIQLPPCLSAVLAARRVLHANGWSLDTIADDLEADQRTEPAPPRVLGLVVVDRPRAMLTLADHVAGSEHETIVRARMLAEVIAARAASEPLPHARLVTRDAWRHQRQLRPYWAAGLLLAISADDVCAILADETTTATVAARRGIPAWLIERRIDQEIAYGNVAGDKLAAMTRMVAHGPRFLDWLAYCDEMVV